MIDYPTFDPVIFSIGPLAIRWYGLMYVLGFAGAGGSHGVVARGPIHR